MTALASLIGRDITHCMFETRARFYSVEAGRLSFAPLDHPRALAQPNRGRLPEQFFNSGSVLASEPLILIAFQR
jgi:hypothetical protein